MGVDEENGGGDENAARVERRRQAMRADDVRRLQIGRVERGPLICCKTRAMDAVQAMRTGSPTDTHPWVQRRGNLNSPQNPVFQFFLWHCMHADTCCPIRRAKNSRIYLITIFFALHTLLYFYGNNRTHNFAVYTWHQHMSFSFLSIRRPRRRDAIREWTKEIKTIYLTLSTCSL